MSSYSSPAVIVYDVAGNPVGTIQDGLFYRLQVEAKIAQTTNKEVYDFGSTVIYVGKSAQGTGTNAPAWLIKKITLVDGNPVLTQWSSTTAIWDNRISETYS